MLVFNIKTILYEISNEKCAIFLRFFCNLSLERFKNFSSETFANKINPSTVDLDEPTEEDLLWVRQTIEKFIQITGSKLGQSILDQWQQKVDSIIKVGSRKFQNKSRKIISLDLREISKLVQKDKNVWML